MSTSASTASPRIAAEAEAWAGQVSGELRNRLRERLAPLPLAVDASELIDSLVAGKLLRARTVFLVGRAYGTPDPDFCLATACALELLHTASLLHDDIIDGSTLRRGRPALHVAADEATAILVADLLIALAFEVAAPYGERATGPSATAFVRLCEGQLQEAGLDWNADALPRIEHYAERKTGALFAAAFACAAAATATEHGAAFSTAGRRLGLAFQFTDDLLDVGADALELGKDSGADLRNGVPSLPLWIAYRTLAGDAEAGRVPIEALAAEAASDRVRTATMDRISALAAECRAMLPDPEHPLYLEHAIRSVLAGLDRLPIPTAEVS